MLGRRSHDAERPGSRSEQPCLGHRRSYGPHDVSVTVGQDCPADAPGRRPARFVPTPLQRAWFWYDWANSGFFTTTWTVLFIPYLTKIAEAAACPALPDGAKCRTSLHVVGVPVSTGSIALYAVTATTILSAFLLPVVGAIADRSGRKRELLAGFAWAGSVVAVCMAFVAGQNWVLGVALLMLSGLLFGSSVVVYDALLIEVSAPDERDAVSSRGWAFGYAGGGILLAMNLALVTAHGSLGLTSVQAVRISLVSAGLWWGLFTVRVYRGLRALPTTRQAAAEESAARSWRQRADVVTSSFGQLAATLRHLRGYPQTLVFLLAYLFFNDGIQTVIATASLFGSKELGLSDSTLVMTILIVQFVALFGALVFGRLAARIGAKRTILSSLVIWCVVVALGYLLPAGPVGPFIALGMGIGFVLGGSQALSRSLFSQLIPLGREAEYFSLYQAAERGTSWFGTLTFGLVYQLTDSYRYAIISLVAFFVIGGVILTRLDVRKGVTDAGNAVPLVV
jgi:UMF1 family MFS transporter